MPQTLVNIKTTQAKALMKNQRIVDSINQVNSELKDQGRVLLRPSGTEPVLRVMVEGFDEKKVLQHAETIRQVIADVECGMH